MKNRSFKLYLPYILVGVFSFGIGYMWQYIKLLNQRNIRTALTVADAGTKVNDIYQAGKDLIGIFTNK